MELKDKKTREFFEVINPYNGEVIENIRDMTGNEILKTLERAYSYQNKLSAKLRSQILVKTAEKIQSRKDELAELISLESGLCLKDTKHEISRVVSCALYSSKICSRLERDTTSDYILDDSNKPMLKVITEPLDLVVAITPFNHPMNQVAHKVFPAIAAGTSMVLKPSEKTPISAVKLIEILYENGLPRDMVSIITSSNPVSALSSILAYPNIDMITFTGGLSVGLGIKKAMVENGHTLTRYVPELGGCSSLIVCSDANIDLASDLVISGCFKNSGQRCTAIRRVVVENCIADKLINKLLEKISLLTFGNPLDDVDIGTVIDENSAKVIEARINDAIENGAKLLYGNKRNNSFIFPTIVDNVDLSMDIVALETFGPVCSIIRTENFDESLSIAKETKYKLAGAIVTSDESKAEKALNSLKVGQFNINGTPGYRTEAAPFGGFGNSGNGEKEGVILAAKGMRRIRTSYEHFFE